MHQHGNRLARFYPAGTCRRHFAVFKKQGIKCDPEQAERVAWRNVRDWVLAQMALVESCDAAVDEVFLPYMTDNSGKTLYQMYSAGRLLPAVH